MPRRRRSALLLVAALLLAACSPGSDPTASADGTLVIAVDAEPSNLNPIFGDVYGTIYGDHWPMFSSLLDHGPDLEPVPDLAVEVPALSDDGTSVTVTVRDDARWHDGEPVTAGDVAFTYRSILDPSVATSLRGLLFDSLESVEAVDDHRVRFDLNRPDPAFLDKLTIGIVPAHLLEGTDLNTAAFNRNPIGSGPFVFEEFRPGERIVMTANPDHHDGVPGLDRIVVRFIADDAARIAELESGGVDVDAAGLSSRAAERFRDRDGFDVVSIPGDLLTLTLPVTNPLFEEARVRRAIGLAIDRQKLVDGLAAGSGRIVDGPFFPDHWAAPDEPSSAFDPDTARAELQDAGWELDGDHLVRDGQRFRFDLVYGHGNVTDTAALAIRDMLADVGIEVRPETLEHGPMVERVHAGAASLQSLGNAYDPALDVFEMYHSSLADDPDGNVARIEDEAIDAAIERGRTALDRDDRIEAYHELQRLLTEQGSWQYLLQADAHYVIGADVEGISPQPREGHNHGFSRGLLWNLASWRIAPPDPA